MRQDRAAFSRKGDAWLNTVGRDGGGGAEDGAVTPGEGKVAFGSGSSRVVVAARVLSNLRSVSPAVVAKLQGVLRPQVFH